MSQQRSQWVVALNEQIGDVEPVAPPGRGETDPHTRKMLEDNRRRIEEANGRSFGYGSGRQAGGWADQVEEQLDERWDPRAHAAANRQTIEETGRDPVTGMGRSRAAEQIAAQIPDERPMDPRHFRREKSAIEKEWAKKAAADEARREAAEEAKRSPTGWLGRVEAKLVAADDEARLAVQDREEAADAAHAEQWLAALVKGEGARPRMRPRFEGEPEWMVEKRRSDAEDRALRHLVPHVVRYDGEELSAFRRRQMRAVGRRLGVSWFRVPGRSFVDGDDAA